MIEPGQRLLFLGVGGMGMAPLAAWLSCAGYSITGYDASLLESVRTHLVAAGVSLRDFLLEEQVAGFDGLVYSSALSEEHPLLQAAHVAGVPCVRRGTLLAELSRNKKLIAIAGSHGKTTTCGLVAYAVQRLGLKVNYILGGLFSGGVFPPSHFCEGEWLVAEVDESDGTIEGFRPEHTVLLNSDWDHADRYEAPEKAEAAFLGLAERTSGKVWLPREERLRAKLSQALAFPEVAGVDVCNDDGLNLNNRLAAATVLEEIAGTVPPGVFANFPGIARRQSIRLEWPDLLVIEDYAHHPTEITALLDALRKRAGERRLHVVFQPHRYSRTRQFCRSFAESLSVADELSLLPVYAAHERLINGGQLTDLVKAFGARPPEVLEFGPSAIARLCSRVVGQPTLLAFVGAGDIEEFAAACVSQLRYPQDRDAAFLDYVRGRCSPDCVVRVGEPLARKTTIGIGGPARLYAEPGHRGDLSILLRACRFFGVAHFCLGRGSNLLVADEGYDGLVIRFAAPEWSRIERLDSDRIWVGVGCRLKELCGFAAREGIVGFEFLEGIPGAVGGALRMNAGAMGSWMFDVVERVQFLDKEGKLQDWRREAFHFGYRKVEEISEGIALGAVLKGRDSAESTVIRGQIDSYANARKESQPRGASAGCIFKNPEGSYAGKLIDVHGLKGLRVGGAEVSTMHGNFILNSHNATAADVIELVRQIRSRVKAASGYELEPEVLLLGQSWDALLREENHG